MDVFHYDEEEGVFKKTSIAAQAWPAHESHGDKRPLIDPDLDADYSIVEVPKKVLFAAYRERYTVDGFGDPNAYDTEHGFLYMEIVVRSQPFVKFVA